MGKTPASQDRSPGEERHEKRVVERGYCLMAFQGDLRGRKGMIKVGQ